jgi:hypothetical protein
VRRWIAQLTIELPEQLGDPASNPWTRMTIEALRSDLEAAGNRAGTVVDVAIAPEEEALADAGWS